MPAARLKIAVVGGGVSGLTAAHLLHPDHDVTVFEAEPRLGGHANTIAVADPAGELGVDTGFIVFNDRNYPLFAELLDELGVATQPSVMGMSIALNDGSFEYANTRNGLFAQPRMAVDPRFWKLISDHRRFCRDVRPMIGRADAPSVAEFLRDGGYSDWYVERAMVPQVAAVWSADPAQLETFPVGFLAEFLANHGQLRQRGRPGWRTITGGSRRYVEALCAPFADRVRTAAAVRRIEREPGGVVVEADRCETERFDEVVIAAHSDQALAMVAGATQAERSVLGAIAYQPNQAVLHTDPTLMPRRRRAWASWNFHLGAEPRDRATLTYWMNNLQGLQTNRDYFVTLNLGERVEASSVLGRFNYSHPVIDHAAFAAQRRWEEISGRDRIHYCGAYWRWGFHEDGCWSAHRACRSLLAESRAVATLQELAA
jgi:predicted NAD/FAD-binding protein